jgi:protocatechuate 3,4-dioxygenase beta subunit
VFAVVGGAPVGGARVTFDNGTRRLAVVTNAEGRFALENIVPGTYRLSVAAKGMTPLFENRFRIAANDPTPYTLRMPRGTLLRVKAVVENPGADTGRHGNRPEGEPVPGAKIVVLCEDTYAYVIGTTNQQGIVEFPGLPAGKYTMNGLAPGFVPFAETTAMIDKKDLVQEETVQFETAVDTPIEVVDEEGRPVAGMEFFGANADDRYDALRSMKAGVTDGDGKLKFAFESDGPRAALYGFKPGYAMVRACPDDYESGDPLRVVAKKPIRVHGRVATPDGRGIADAVVAISISASEQNPNEDDVELEIRTNAEGQYDFPFLPHSDGITITATAPDGISEDEKDLEVVAGRTDYTVDITIELEDAGSTPPPKKK